jgi:TatD DNase family protein
VYEGKYHGKQQHPSDLPSVLQRARTAGCQKLIVTGSDMEESKRAIELARAHPGMIYATVGVHPCSSLQFTRSPPSSEAHLAALRALAESASAEGHAVAFGEIGLDYDRLALCPKDVQLEYFAAQLDIAVTLNLPLFLHSRAAHEDFSRLLRERLDRLPRRGVVHSFTGTEAEMRELVEMGFDIGVNGCSMKLTENVDVVREIPLERIQLETDGPWCEMRASHASSGYLEGFGGEGCESVKKERWAEGKMVKGRNEPCTIGRVAWAVARIKGLEVKELTEAAWANTVRMFGFGEGRLN